VPEKRVREKWPPRQAETAFLQALMRIYAQKLKSRAQVAHSVLKTERAELRNLERFADRNSKYAIVSLGRAQQHAAHQKKRED
jgi:hypothetical protein